jgi:hypothetical protein
MCSGNPLGMMDSAFAMDANTPFSFLFFLWWTPYNTDVRVVASVGGLCFGSCLWVRLAYSDSGDEWQHERDFVFAICMPNQTVGRYRLRGLI